MLISTFHRGRLLGRAGPGGGSATHLGITTQPSSTATSGTAFSQQPVIALLDALGSSVSQSGVVVTASIASGTGALGGTTTATTNSSGVATFTNLSITGASTDTISFTATSLTGATSSSIVVSSSSFADPDVIWNDWSGGAITSGGLITGREFTNDTPGHNSVITNPTGVTPWTKSSSTKVVQIFYDVTLGDDINQFFSCDPSAYQAFSYGDTWYVGMWVYLQGSINNDSFRKIIYGRYNAGQSSDTQQVALATYNDNVWFGNDSSFENSPDNGQTSPHGGNWASAGVGTCNLQTWYFVEVATTCNSARGVADGAIQMWVNGTRIINETGYLFSLTGYPTGTSYTLDFVGFGYQLENAFTSGGTSENRYVGPCAISTQRIGSL